MSSLTCYLPIKNWLVSEIYDPSSDFTIPTREITLFGTVTDSNEYLLDGFSFQVVFLEERTTKKSVKVKIDGNHLFARFIWPQEALDKIESQLSNKSLMLSFGLVLRFDEAFTFELPKNTSCKVMSLIKSIKNT
jgi:hypothetical protein